MTKFQIILSLAATLLLTAGAWPVLDPGRVDALLRSARTAIQAIEPAGYPGPGATVAPADTAPPSDTPSPVDTPAPICTVVPYYMSGWPTDVPVCYGGYPGPTDIPVLPSATPTPASYP